MAASTEGQGGGVRVVVLGAGITGLSAAYELTRLAASERRQVDILVLEASARIGGKIWTENREGCVIEGGPDSFVTLRPHAVDLARELGLGGELVGSEPGDSTVSVLWNGRLIDLPPGTGILPRRLLPFLGCPLFTWKGKARMALEVLLPRGDDALDESLASFVRRRLGQEALERLLGPMLAGIHAGDPEQLSVSATFPQLKEFERRGGIIRNLMKRAPKKEGGLPMFMTLKGGLGRLVETLALKLPPRAVRTGAAAKSLRRRAGRWQVELASGELVIADAVISALAANALSAVTADLDFELSCVLREIPFASTATVTTIFDEASLPQRLRGYGFLIPRSQGKATMAATFSSVKFPSRAPLGQAMIRCFAGGAGRDACVDADDALIARRVRGELKDILGLGEAHPKMTRVFRWLKANPQYMVGHGLRVKRIESCLQAHPGLVLAGCSYYGVGVADCIRSGREAAARALRGVAGRSAQTAVA